jgi:hypothetical protein
MKDYKLGVLFVHGIGTQSARETLVRWGDVLLNVIARAAATPGKVIPIVGRASGGDRSGDNPAEVLVDIHYGDQSEKWLLAEGWWAGSFPAPTYSELVSWCVRAAPWSIALHIAQRYWQTDPGASGRAKLIAYTTAIFKLIAAMALAPVFIALLALALLLGLLPIPHLRSLIISTQTTLIGTVGESLAFVESPLRAAFIRSRIVDALERLKARCERTVIVAHSQGAAAVLDALGGITQAREREEPTDPELSTGSPIPDALVTFGSGVNQLVSLKVLAAGLPNGSNPAVAASLAITVAIIPMLYFSFRSGPTDVRSLGEAAALLLGIMIFTRLLIGGVEWLFDKLTKWGLLAERKKAGYDYRKLWILGPIGLVGFIAYLIYYERLPADIAYPMGVLVNALIFFWLSLKVILSPANKDAVTKPVRNPRGLPRWLDLYSSADPVPSGPTRISEMISSQTSSVPVWNRGSILSDHTTYWENLDGFVLRVVQVCAATAESPWQDKLLPATRMNWVDRRAAWRVRFLQWTLRINIVFWSAFTIIWVRHGAIAALPFEIPSWSPAWALTAGRFAELGLFFVLCAWATAGLLRWSWTRWVRAEQELILAHKNPSNNSLWNISLPLYGMGIVITALLMLASALLLKFEPRELLTPELFGLPVFLNMGGYFFAAIVPRLMPVPDPTDTPDQNV